MSYAFKKIYVAVAALMVAAAGQSQVAADNSQIWGGYGGNCCLSDNCCQPECCPQACGTWSVSAGLLYWRAYEGGLICDCIPGEITDVVDNNGHTNSHIKGGHNDFDQDWELGFRLGAGYQFACSQWELGAYWTHFHDHARAGHDGHNSHENNWESNFHSGNNHFSHWNLNFDEVDLVAGYRCELCPCFTLTPFLGLRGVRIDQTLHSQSSLVIFDEFDGGFVFSRHHDKEKFWGVGPVLGLEAEWGLGCGFSVYGCVDTSVLYGRFDNDFDGFEEVADVSTVCDSSVTRDAALLAGDAGLGVRWGTCFCNGMHLTLQLGWEHHHYFDYNQLGSNGDLSLDGVTFSAGIDF